MFTDVENYDVHLIGYLYYKRSAYANQNIFPST